jgi:hypothetical protein
VLRNLTDEEIEQRLKIVENMIAKERDTKSLCNLNVIFQRLIDEQVSRDLELVDSH